MGRLGHRGRLPQAPSHRLADFPRILAPGGSGIERAPAWCRLRRAEGPRQERDGRRRDRPRKGPRNMSSSILVIDDEPDVCELVSATLTADDTRVVATTSPGEGLHLLENEGFDAVLTDIVMKELSGLDVCRRVAAVDPAIPVIV